MKVHVGTSGWNYESFRPFFYGSIPKRRFFEHYVSHFDTVELNASFYRNFPQKTWEGWYRKSPQWFIWSVKASKFITHIKRLSVDEVVVARFFEQVQWLREKAGACLFQLPPNLEYKREHFLRFLEILSKERYSCAIALEARHPSWHTDEVFDILEEHSIAWVISHTGGRYPMTIASTGPVTYVRLHGPERLYHGEYGEEALKKWLEAIFTFEKEAFVYFDNTDDGSAIKDALLFKEMATAI